MPTLELIRERISGYVPALAADPDPRGQAAVALIVRELRSGAPEILFIERARREGDPWSGQMAFPGGRRDLLDDDLCATAVRETLEEVGLKLREPIGRLDDVDGRRGPARSIVVSPFVFDLLEDPALRPSEEVEAAVWIPVPRLLRPESGAHYRMERAGETLSLPAVRCDRYTIWGLTYRILGRFFELLGRDLPPG